MRRCKICPYHRYIKNLTGEDLNEISCGLEECRVSDEDLEEYERKEYSKLKNIGSDLSGLKTKKVE